MGLYRLFFDNPVLIKHVRSRLRRGPVVTLAVAVLALCAFLTWATFALGGADNGTGFWTLLVGQSLLLFVAGSGQATGSLLQARQVGILDFHRISPQRPLALVVGFLLGGPIREWLLFAMTVPFGLLLGVWRRPGILGVLAVYTDVVVVALLYHALSVCAGLVARVTRQAQTGVVAFVLVGYFVFGQVLGGVSGPGFLTILPTAVSAADRAQTATFFGVALPVVVHSLLHQIPILGLTLLAATRKMRQDQAAFFSKPQAVLAFAVVAVLLLGDMVGFQPPTGTLASTGVNTAVLGMPAFLLWLTASIMIALSTPTARELVGGVIRARRAGKSRPGPWDAPAGNTSVMLACSAILVVTVGVGGLLRGAGAAALMGGAVAVLTLVYFAAARQAFEVRWKGSGNGYFALFLFLLWAGPPIAGAILGIGQRSSAEALLVSAVSPFVGIWAATSLGSADFAPAAAGIALGSAAILAVALTQFRLLTERVTFREAAADGG